MSEATVDATVDNSRRTWLITSCAMGGVGAAAVAVPFVSSFQPSERAKAAGAAVEVDVSTEHHFSSFAILFVEFLNSFIYCLIFV